jgi:uncharacterized membrane protein YhhN
MYSRTLVRTSGEIEPVVSVVCVVVVVVEVCAAAAETRLSEANAAMTRCFMGSTLRI